VRDWPQNHATISPNHATGVSLNDETHFPKLCDWETYSPKLCGWHFDLLPLRSGQSTATPRSVIAQQPAGDVHADFQTVAPEDFIHNALGSPAGTARQRIRDPPRDLDCLGLTEGAALAIERGFDPACRRLSGMRLTDPSDSSSCQVSEHLDVVVGLLVKDKIYGPRGIGKCPTTCKDSEIIPAPDSSFRENDIPIRTSARASARYCS
jgi:hypothetical protein